MAVRIQFPYRAHADTMQMIERLVEQGLLGKNWLERPSLAEYAHESYTRMQGRVLARDNYTCQYCGTTDEELACDHLIPRSRGGINHPDNLVAACKPCNSSKGNKTLEEWLIPPPVIRRKVPRRQAEIMHRRITAYCTNDRGAPQFYEFLLLVHELNRLGLALSTRTSTDELATRLGCQKPRVSQFRRYGLKMRVLLFEPDPLDPGTGWYGINPHFDEWIAPPHGPARAGAGRPLGTYGPIKRGARLARKKWWEQ